MTVKKFKKLCLEWYHRGYERGIAKGYELGYLAGKAAWNKRGFIFGSQVDKDLDELLRKKNEG